LKKLDNAKRVADSMDMYVTGSHKFFNNRSNVDINNRLVCFDVKDLNLELRKIGMLIIQDAVWNKVAKNRYNGTKTWYYMDEFHLLLQHEQTASYSVEMWKRFRKWNGFPTGITQNIKDLLQTQQIESIFDNTDFICMLSQADGDRDIIMNKKNLSKEQIEYVTNSTEGEGLIIYGKSVLPFKDKFPTDTELFKLLNTKPSSVKLIK
jgi:type IV secretory pathway VirB4 component